VAEAPRTRESGKLPLCFIAYGDVAIFHSTTPGPRVLQFVGRHAQSAMYLSQENSQSMAPRETSSEDGKHNGRSFRPNSLTNGPTHGICDAVFSGTSTKVEDEKRNAENETSQDTEAIKPMAAMDQAVSSREALNEKGDSPTGPPGTRYLNPKELAWVSFAFTLATSMLALDVSIIGACLHPDAGNLLTSFSNSNRDSQHYQSVQQPRRRRLVRQRLLTYRNGLPADVGTHVHFLR